jgi:hypothetical protein
VNKKREQENERKRGQKRKIEQETKTVPKTKPELIAELTKYAELSGLTLENYCQKEGIDLSIFGDN